ncbi:MAG: alpha/beta fold hydrolase [Gaiellaceae bacterium]
MPIVELSTGVSLNYESYGRGEPVLLIMGTGADNTLWEPTVGALGDAYRVITFDNRGTGQSSCPAEPERYSMALLAEDAVALLDVLEIERAHISGLSLGSAVAQEIAINHPDRVVSAQLHCTWARTDAWLARLFESMAYPIRHNDMEAFIRQAFMWVLSPAYLAERPDEVAAIERGYLLENPHPPTKEGLLGHLHADLTHDTLERLNQIDAPTLITSGEMDAQVPARYGRAVHELIADSRMHLFDGPYSSHMAFTEMAEEFNAVSRAFVDEHAAG